LQTLEYAFLFRPGWLVTGGNRAAERSLGLRRFSWMVAGTWLAANSLASEPQPQCAITSLMMT
jgi:hypothetical protein